MAPKGWYGCVTEGMTEPDVQPGVFEVSLEAADGDTYLGMVVRDNNTWEGVSQRLDVPLLTSRNYTLQAAMSRSELLISISRATGEEVNYSTPSILRVWGSNNLCDKAELLAESPVISNTEWIDYELSLQPKTGNYLYITLEAYYQSPVLFPYNGNLLIDNLRLTANKK